MKKDINSTKEAKVALREHIKNMAIKKKPYAIESANKKMQPTQKPRG